MKVDPILELVPFVSLVLAEDRESVMLVVQGRARVQISVELVDGKPKLALAPPSPPTPEQLEADKKRAAELGELLKSIFEEVLGDPPPHGDHRPA